ncbi:MAG: proline--tRNA ligase [bacterium]|nr:proline--tRNA ligase [bacterium]MDE0288992.1 proline--tRNA ligase [bacterium]MDE0439916.1 proline--tRNA ligase [bacterium]
MRWSRTFIPTLRDDPADAVAPSHRLLVRGGFIRQLMAGSYSLLPLGMRVAQKVSSIIREEMDAIGGQEFLAPVVHPAEVWKRTGRWDDVEGIMVKFEDRKGADLVLALTHEEVFAHLATEMSSYRELPQLWYHLQTKFRDEARPRSGLLRVREFVMKDSYSFDLDESGLDVQFEAHRGAYDRIFGRMGLDAVQVEASSGNMGGSDSVEFVVRSPTGEDRVALCGVCGYAANLERAVSTLDEIVDEDWQGPPARFPTPGVRTIAALAGLGEFASAERQIKTLVYMVGDRMHLVAVRGDHELEVQKLADAVTDGVRPATAGEIFAALGAHPGSLGAVGVDLPVIADPALRGRSNMVTGANEDDFHLRGVDVERDIDVGRWLDLRSVEDGEACGRCFGGTLSLSTVIEVGHIFKLGLKYSRALGAEVLDESGRPTPLVMGSYGIGVGRSMAAIVEARHDAKGIVWPVSVAPFAIVVTLLRPDRSAVRRVGERLYHDLSAAGMDVILDDRNERPGVKFADAELVGIPYRLTVGPRGVDTGRVELRARDNSVDESVEFDGAVARMVELIP